MAPLDAAAGAARIISGGEDSRLNSRPRKTALLVIVAAAMAASAAGIALAIRGDLPRRFDTVVDGRLFRSGEVTPAQLERISQRYGVRAVISLLDPTTDESRAEAAVAERLGMRWINVPLTGDGASTPESRERIKAALFDESLGPTLVHCAAGANRTGLTIGMYRIHKQGWTATQVLDEMRSYGFEDLPKHQNLRDALAAEEALAAAARQADDAGR